MVWGQLDKSSLTCHPKGSGSHLAAHQTPRRYQTVSWPQGSDPAGKKKRETFIHLGSESEVTSRNVQDGEPQGFDSHRRLNYGQAPLTSPCIPSISSCSAAWLSFFILPFFFTSASLGLERSPVPFLTPGFCQRERKVRVHCTAYCSPSPSPGRVWGLTEMMLESWGGVWGLCILLRCLAVVESWPMEVMVGETSPLTRFWGVRWR